MPQFASFVAQDILYIQQLESVLLYQPDVPLEMPPMPQLSPVPLFGLTIPSIKEVQLCAELVHQLPMEQLGMVSSTVSCVPPPTQQTEPLLSQETGFNAHNALIHMFYYQLQVLQQQLVLVLLFQLLNVFLDSQL